MTAFSDADLDRLADFVGGALDGTPEADDVRHLVSTDTVWAEAYAMLVTADAAVRDELHALGGQAAAVPLEVQNRLDEALAQAVSAPPATAPVVDLERARAARRRRRMPWVVGLASAAAAVVCVALGVQILRPNVGTESTTADTAAAPPAVAAQSPGQAERNGAGSPLISSGRDYGKGNLGDLAGRASQDSRTNQGKSTLSVQGEGGATGAAGAASAPASVPGPLARLQDPAARAECLTAITREYGGQVALVDYAAFEGQPALVVIVDGSRVATGQRLVVVVGPTCGLGGAIADERYRTTAP